MSLVWIVRCILHVIAAVPLLVVAACGMDNPIVLLVRVEHIDGRPMEPELLTEATFKELCTYTNPSHTPHAVEILTLHEICLTYQQGITLGHIAGELMAIESWMDVPILVTVVIIKRSKVDAIVEVRQKH